MSVVTQYAGPVVLAWVIVTPPCLVWADYLGWIMLPVAMTLSMAVTWLAIAVITRSGI